MNRPPASPVPDDKSAPGTLLFAWASQGGLAAHLGKFAAISLVVHLLGFYLFQVVYPVTGRIEPKPSRVQLLDPSHPSVSALMRQIDDRLVYLRPASSGTEVRVDLNDHSAQFRPSFSGRSAGFLPIPLPATAPTPQPAP